MITSAGTAGFSGRHNCDIWPQKTNSDNCGIKATDVNACKQAK